MKARKMKTSKGRMDKKERDARSSHTDDHGDDC